MLGGCMVQLVQHEENLEVYGTKGFGRFNYATLTKNWCSKGKERVTIYPRPWVKPIVDHFHLGQDYDLALDWHLKFLLSLTLHILQLLCKKNLYIAISCYQHFFFPFFPCDWHIFNFAFHVTCTFVFGPFVMTCKILKVPFI